MEARLDPSGNDVLVDDVILRTPGLEGNVRVVTPGATTMRAEAEWPVVLEEVLAAEGMRPQLLVEISGHEETPGGAPATRSTRAGEDGWELIVPAPNEQWGQLVLHTDEAGVSTWEFALDAQGAVDATRGGGGRTYVVRRRVAPPEPAGGQRGLITAIGRKVLAVVAFRLVDPVIGAVGEYFAGKWEQRKRPYRLRTFTPDDYAQPEGALIDDRPAWERLAGGRALLLVHGTFSRAHTGFGGMPRTFVEELHRRYEGRVFAFDHYTLSEDPRRNIEWLLARLPADVDLDVDIICHSRGGLVSRTLAEKQGELSAGRRAVKVGRVVFVATPNGGTALADARHMGRFIDSYTNLASFLPDNGVTDVLEGAVTVAKILATGTAKGLDGLRAMDPRSEFLPWLNTAAAPGAEYSALAADFEPTNRGWKQWARDALMDAIFHAANDLVVPTTGVYDANGSSLFPIAKRLEFGRGDGVSHSTFFGEERARERILAWLAG